MARTTTDLKHDPTAAKTVAESVDLVSVPSDKKCDGLFEDCVHFWGSFVVGLFGLKFSVHANAVVVAPKFERASLAIGFSFDKNVGGEEADDGELLLKLGRVEFHGSLRSGLS